MGSNINEFIVRLEFDPDGDVKEVIYWDQEGCGHEHSVGLTDLVRYHLHHYRESHDRVPPRKCPVELETADKGRLRCSREPHAGDDRHTFEVRM